MTVKFVQNQIALIKVVIFLAALLPMARLVLFSFWGKLGANPIEFITRSSGDWTLYFICITLAITPLRQLTKWNWLIGMRRMLGLFAFFYGISHFIAFVWFDHFFDLQTILKDVLKRPFVTIGFAALLLLFPLAITSTKSMMKRMGKQWKMLHRLVYLIAVLALIHFWWMRAGKQNFTEPILIGVVILVLFFSRILIWGKTRDNR